MTDTQKKKGMKSVPKQLLQWAGALMLCAFIMNLLMFGLYHPVNELPRSGGASPGLKDYPDYGLYGFEGYARQTIDSRGYVNPDLPLEEHPWIIVGASHAEGFHTGKGRRCSDLLNKSFGYTDSLKFCNISHSEYFLTDIVERYEAIQQEFPGMAGIIIDIDDTGADPGKLREALDHPKSYDPSRDSLAALKEQASSGQRLAYGIKRLTPGLRELSLQYQSYIKSRQGEDMDRLSHEEEERDEGAYLGQYEEVMGEALEYLAEVPFDVIIVCHPGVIINEDGTMTCGSEATDDIMERLCKESGITYIDMRDAFLESYENSHTVPFGFMNTSPATGHINDSAHRMMADALYEVIRRKAGAP